MDGSDRITFQRWLGGRAPLTPYGRAIGQIEQIRRTNRPDVKDLGFVRTRVHSLRRAYARFEPDGAIVIWGTSDEYGCCDKQEAARMTARTYPGRPVRIEA